MPDDPRRRPARSSSVPTNRELEKRSSLRWNSFVVTRTPDGRTRAAFRVASCWYCDVAADSYCNRSMDDSGSRIWSGLCGFLFSSPGVSFEVMLPKTLVFRCCRRDRSSVISASTAINLRTAKSHLCEVPFVNSESRNNRKRDFEGLFWNLKRQRVAIVSVFGRALIWIFPRGKPSSFLPADF